MSERTSSPDVRGSGDAVELERATQALQVIITQIDSGELESTSPERAHLMGAVNALRTLSATGTR